MKTFLRLVTLAAAMLLAFGYSRIGSAYDLRFEDCATLAIGLFCGVIAWSHIPSGK